MPFATGARHEIGFIAEATWGTTPATPAMKRLRHTSSNLGLTKQTITSSEIRADRQISDLRHGNRQVGGDVAFEFSFGSFDDFLESALFGAWATNVLKAGTTMKSFTIERYFADITQYMQMTGCVVNQLSLRIAPNAMVTGSMSIIGKDMVMSGTTLDAAGGYDDTTTNSPFDSFSGTLSEGGSNIATVTALELNLDNGLTPAMVVGSATSPQLLTGASNLTGSLTAYFENLTLLNKFINETESSLSIALNTDGTGKDYTLLIPRLKYTGGELPVTAANEGILLNMPFQALRDPTEASNIKITRVP